MAITNTVKKPMQTYRKRTLFKIEETYDNGIVYHGYYVENSSKTRKRGQAYRHMTISNEGVTNIEDENALKKAINILKNGFPF